MTENPSGAAQQPVQPTTDAAREPAAEGGEQATPSTSHTATDARSGPTADELEDRWQRALADADNLRKRHVRELEQVREAERARVAAAFVPVVDNLERALAHADADGGQDALITGLLAVHDQAVAILASLGYPRDADAGVPFDPARHEVVGVVDDAQTEPGTVVRILHPGYGTPGRQLRPAAVVVARRESPDGA